MYLDRVRAQYEVLGCARTHGCTEAEIQSIEHQLGVMLPAAYREFLGWAGHDAGDIFLDVEEYAYAQVLEFQELGRALVEASTLATPLPADAVVFHIYDAFQFTFFRVSEGDDPPVYDFLELPSQFQVRFEGPEVNIDRAVDVPLSRQPQFRKGETFSQWLMRYIEGLEEAAS